MYAARRFDQFRSCGERGLFGISYRKSALLRAFGNMSSNAQTPDDDPPTSLGPYQVLETIGRGGSATVYKARHRQSGELVAIKVGPALMALEPSALERFRREFSGVRDLSHPNLVSARALGDERGVPYLVMEYVAGENLDEYLRSTGPLSARKAVAIFLQIAEGLRYLHGKQILHRDIKPANIFLRGLHDVKLGDFGLLKNLIDTTQLTRSRHGMGTVEYGAPEQFEDAKRVDRRCDLYSLGGSLYTALTGVFPFGNGGQLQIMQRKLQGQFVPLRLFMPNIHPELDDLVCRCLEVAPTLRPNDCDEVLAVLNRCAAHPTVAAQSPKGADTASADADGSPERRATVRFAVDLTAAFVPFHQNMRGRWQATILDVSTAGICMQTSRSVAVHSVLQVMLGKRATPELVLVRWVRAGEGDTQIAGCSFVRPLQDRDLEAFFPAAPTKLSLKSAAAKAATTRPPRP
jgi:serine/threonine protein kinase